jgi:lysophospholipase
MIVLAFAIRAAVLQPETWVPADATVPMDFLGLPENPVPADSEVVPLVTADGIRLRAARFAASPRSRPAGTVCLFQGRAEQIEKYFAVIERLQRRGFCVATLDWRGQGGSQRLASNPMKGHVPDFLHYERDIDAFRRLLALPDCPPPFFGLGHSLGGHVLLRAAPRLRPWLQRIVLAAPFLDFGAVPFSRAAIRRMSGTLRWTGFGRAYLPPSLRRYAVVGGFEANPLTSDPERFSIMASIGKARPDLTIGAPTVGWTNAAARSIDAIEDGRFAETVQTPVLIVNAGADRVVSVQAVERMAQRLRGAAYVLVPGARHELMMERDVYAAQFWAAFDAYVPGGGPV